MPRYVPRNFARVAEMRQKRTVASDGSAAWLKTSPSYGICFTWTDNKQQQTRVLAFASWRPGNVMVVDPSKRLRPGSNQGIKNGRLNLLLARMQNVAAPRKVQEHI